MEHFYNATQIAKLISFISENINDETITDATLAGQDISYIRKLISTMLKDYPKTFDLDFQIKKEKNKRDRKFTRLEAHQIIFIIIYKSENNSFISKVKNNKQYSLDEIDVFYNDLIRFLNDDRFKTNGVWYNEEKTVLKLKKNERLQTRPDLTFNFFQKQRQFYRLKAHKEEMINQISLVVRNCVEEILPDNNFSKIPFISKQELEVLYNQINNGDINLYDNEFDYTYKVNEGLFKGQSYILVNATIKALTDKCNNAITHIIKHPEDNVEFYNSNSNINIPSKYLFEEYFGNKLLRADKKINND